MPLKNDDAVIQGTGAPSGYPGRSVVSPDRIGPDDSRYLDLVNRGFYGRFRGNPDYVYLVWNAAQVVEAVQDALGKGLHLAVRSGGHCLEGFVADQAVRAVIDTSMMDGISYDPNMRAFAVEPGARLGEVYRTLFLGWGVTIPGAVSPDVGVGGHILGGGFGSLSRQHGLAADHLYGVEVVVVDQTGTARIVVATREDSDPNRDLWWAHTGGGGGNFGIVTRYWMRSGGVGEDDPSRMLPKAPASVLRFRATWNWADVDARVFGRLMQNYGAWCERNGEAGSPGAQLYSTIVLPRRESGKIELTGISTAGNGAERLFDEHLAALNEGTGIGPTRESEVVSWLAFALYPFPEVLKRGPGGNLSKMKDAFLRKPLTDRQIGVAYDYLTSPRHTGIGGNMGMSTHGGKINAVSPEATASAQRESIISMSCSVGWADPQSESRSLTWVRELYRGLFAETGGVPTPGEMSDGAFINHPDVDMADPAWNTSLVPWYFLYYKDNYPRLQRVKARWDPLDVFHHALSIRPA